MEIAAVEQANRREQDDFENQVRRVEVLAERAGQPTRKAATALIRSKWLYVWDLSREIQRGIAEASRLASQVS